MTSHLFNLNVLDNFCVKREQPTLVPVDYTKEDYKTLINKTPKSLLSNLQREIREKTSYYEKKEKFQHLQYLNGKRLLTNC